MLVVPAGIVLTLFQLLVGPMAGLVAVGTAFSLVPGLDPAGAALAGLFPATRGPSPPVILTVPGASDPDVVRAGPFATDFMPRRGRSVRGDPNVDRRELNADPDLGKCGRAGEQRERRG